MPTIDVSTLSTRVSLDCVPWIAEGRPDLIEQNLTEILSGFGVEELDGLSILLLEGGQGPLYGPKSQADYFIFVYLIENAVGERLLRVSGLMIERAGCVITLMAQ